MFKNQYNEKFIYFIIFSLILHLLLFLWSKNPFVISTKNIAKNKEKKPIRVKFIDLPDKLKEIKHKEKTPYIAQKSFKAQKQTKKNNPLIKKKAVVVTEKIPTVPNSQIAQKSKKTPPSQKRKNNQKTLKEKKKVAKKIKKNLSKPKSKPEPKPKSKPKPKPKPKKIVKIKKKKTIVSLNKIAPTYEELIKDNLLDKTSQKNQKKTTKNQNKKKLSKVFKEHDVGQISPNIFQPSHIYPDDIDISDSISITTQSSRFASYLHKVKRKIELVWEYPKIAGELGIQGRLFVKFTINKDGTLEKVELLKSSGAKILDQEALRAIREAAPYPPFPKDNSFGVNRIKIHACFEYIISGKEIW